MPRFWIVIRHRLARIAAAGIRLSAAGAFLLGSPAYPQVNSNLRLGVGDAFSADPPQLIEQRLGLYERAGIGIVRVDMEWRMLEPVEGEWRDAQIGALIPLVARHGLKLKADIGSIQGPPQWFFARHPEAQLTNQDGLRSYHDISYWYPGLHALLEDKDDRLFATLARLRLLGALAYVVVPFGPAGEPLYPAPWTTTDPHGPMRFWFYDPNAQADFPRKMQEKYGSISAANRRWGTQFRGWDEVTLPRPGSRPGVLWGDVLDWYRDAKRGFIRWQVAHYQRLLRKYFPTGGQPKLVLLVPANHVRPFDDVEAVRTGDGSDNVKMMADSMFLLDMAHQVHAQAQYTGLPNLYELEYLRSCMRRRGYAVPLWGENSGNLGEAQELDEEVVAEGLYGQEYIGDNLFAPDHVTPSARFDSLQRAHFRLSDRWAHSAAPLSLSFEFLPIVQGGCVYANLGGSVELCMRDDGALALINRGKTVWTSGTAHRERDYCSTTEDPGSTCHAEFQGDGNLVVSRGAKPVWSSRTEGRGNRLLLGDRPPYMQILDAHDQVIWSASAD